MFQKYFVNSALTSEEITQLAQHYAYQKAELAPQLIAKMLDWGQGIIPDDYPPLSENEYKRERQIDAYHLTRFGHYMRGIQCLAIWGWSDLDALEKCINPEHRRISLATLRLILYTDASKFPKYYEAFKEDLHIILQETPPQNFWGFLAFLYPKIGECNPETLAILGKWVQNATNPDLQTAICTSCKSHTIERKIEQTSYYICRTCETALHVSTDFHKIGAYIGSKPANEEGICWVSVNTPSTETVQYVEADILSLDKITQTVDYDRLVNELINVFHNQHPMNPLKIELRISPDLTFDDNTMRLLDEIRA